MLLSKNHKYFFFALVLTGFLGGCDSTPEEPVQNSESLDMNTPKEPASDMESRSPGKVGDMSPASSATEAGVGKGGQCTGNKYSVLTTRLNIRQSPALHSAIVGHLGHGEKVLILDTKGSWGKVAEGQWVSMKYLKQHD